MSRSPERGVDNRSGRHRSHQFGDLVEQDRKVLELAGHGDRPNHISWHRSSAAPRTAVVAGMSPRLTRRKRAELGLSILPAGRLQKSVSLRGAWLVSSFLGTPFSSWLRAPQLCGAPLADLVIPVRIPDLDSVKRACYHYPLAGGERPEVTQGRFDIDATLPVDGHFEGVMGKGTPCISTHLALPHLLVCFLCHEFKILTGVHVDAPVIAESEETRRFEFRTKRRRQGHAALGVELSLVPSDEHPSSFPSFPCRRVGSFPTGHHRNPQFSPGQPITRHYAPQMGHMDLVLRQFLTQ